MLDDITQITTKNDEGETVQQWVTIKNPQLKHINMCMNEITDDIESTLDQCFRITGDDFGLTLSSNKLSDEAVNRLNLTIQRQHKINVELALNQAEAEGRPIDEIQADDMIHLRRLAV
jgi:hypothetical protein